MTLLTNPAERDPTLSQPGEYYNLLRELANGQCTDQQRRDAILAAANRTLHDLQRDLQQC